MKKKNWENYEFYSIPFDPLNKIISVYAVRESGLAEKLQAFDMKSFVEMVKNTKQKRNLTSKKSK